MCPGALTRLRFLLTLAAACLLSFSLPAQSFGDSVLGRYRGFLVEQAVIDTGDVRGIVGSVTEDGRWDDVDYADKRTGSWQPKTHLDRMLALAAAYSKEGTRFYQDASVKAAVDRTLNNWTAHRYRNTNWWYNDILTPQRFRDILLLMAPYWTAQQRAKALSVMAQHHVGGTGANLTWTADIGLHYGLLTGNDSLANKCAALLAGEIKQGAEEGIQPDYSFRQHGARLQMYHYGKAYLFENIRLAWQLRGTPWAYPQSSAELLIKVVLNGYWWMARGINTVPSTIDRAVSRKGSLASADVRSLVPYLKQLSPKNNDSLDKLTAWQNGDYTALQGFRYFPYSDFSVYHNKAFSFFIKTISTRTLGTESINNENLKGGGLNNGNTWVLSAGNEYDDLAPLWDWDHLPGSTVAATGLPIRRQPFSGGAGDGKSGMVAMSQEWGGSDTGLVARKAWALHNGVVVCLTAGIRATGTTAPVVTTLEQCRLRGDLTVNQPSNKLPFGTNPVGNAKWLHHAGLLYLPLSESALEVRIQKKTGSWWDINRNGSDDKISDAVFMPVWIHRKGEDAIGYAVTACATAKDASRIAAQRSWTVLANNEHCQAVLFNDGTLMLSIFNPEADRPANVPVWTSRPCVLLKKKNALFVADPLHRGGEVTVFWKQKKWNVVLPADGTTTQIELQ